VAKTIQKVRSEQAAERKEANNQAFLRRLRCRQLLFGKSNGRAKNLPYKEQLFVRSVWKECYRAYIIEFQTGKPRPWYEPCAKRYRRVNRNKEFPMSPQKHRRRWFASQKARWIRYDVPNMISQRFDAEAG
jgi:hypothetical protein